MKRLFDLVTSILGLILLSPLILIISIGIKLNDKGPVFFKQKRVGKDGILFMLYKFRSMRTNESSEEGSFEPGNTSRVTSTGKFLRKTKLDELPQMINVLRGDMSLVGPRPEIEKWVAVYPERWEKVLYVKPGITDNASVEFRNEEDILSGSANPDETYRDVILPRKLELYIDYVDHQSFLGDIKIIFRTVKAILVK